MALKYCPACDENHDVDDEVTTCPDCGGPLEAAEDEDEGEWEDEGGGWESE